MTSLHPMGITCPGCGTSFTKIVYTSINTLMDPEPVKRILEDKLGATCPGCGKVIHLDYNIMIVTRNGMVMVSTADPVEVNRQKLLEHQVIDDHGNVLGGFGFHKPPKQ